MKSIKENHNYPRLDVNKMGSHPWLASQLITAYNANTRLELSAMQELLMERYGLSIWLHTCYRAEKLLKEWTEGKHEDAYSKQLEYIEEIKRKNPRTVASCVWTYHDGKPIFKRLFISFEAMTT